MTNPLLFAALGYVLGSIPFAVVMSRLFGLADPRTFGSGNPGATNVLRTGNKLAAALTLLGDALKGWAAIFVAGQMGATIEGIALAGLGAFLGHVFPVSLGFKGGKGVATALGVLAGFNGWLALACAGIWLLVAVVTRYSSLAAILAAVAAPTAAWWLVGKTEVALAVVAMSMLLILRHRTNMARLLSGTEPRIGSKKTTP